MNIGKQLRTIARKRSVDLEQVVRETVIQLGASIIFKTPVDTGAARGSWVAQVGMNPDDLPERNDKSGTLTINANRAVANGLNVGDTFYWVSNLPYMDRLENGNWSDQAPNGMVKVSIAELPGILDRQIARIG